MNVISCAEAKSQNLTRYFTGKPCKHGHVAERYVLNWTCVVCHAAKCAEFLPKWREKNPEKTKTYNEKYAERHKETNKLWRASNKQRCLETQRKWNELNNEKRNLLSSKWRKQNRHIVNALHSKWKTQLLQRMPTWLTEDDWWMIEQIYHLAQLRTAATSVEWHVDHIIPLRGKTVSGLHVPANLQVIPAKLNLKKGNRYAADPVEV